MKTRTDHQAARRIVSQAIKAGLLRPQTKDLSRHPLALTPAERDRLIQRGLIRS